MDNLRGLLNIRRIDRVPNAWIKELFAVRKGLDERIDEVSYNGSAMWRGWRRKALLRESM